MVKIAAVEHLKRVFSHLERDSKKQAENFFRDFFTNRQQKMVKTISGHSTFNKNIIL
jgi:hypothetical protein